MEEKNKMYDELEKRANYFCASTLVLAIIFLIVAWMFNILGIFDIQDNIMNGITIVLLIVVSIPVTLTLYLKGSTKWLKFVLIMFSVLSICLLHAVLGYNAVLISIFPILISCHYYSEKLTFFTSVITCVGLFFAEIFNVYFGVSDYNMIQIISGITLKFENGVIGPENVPANVIDYGTTLIDTFRYSFIPHAIEIIILGEICHKISTCTRQLIKKNEEIIEKAAHIKAELSVAENIQKSMLPVISPSFPGRKEFDISVSMAAAKQIGGDFYDVFFIDSDHIVIVIGDVLGSGVPAALFMALTKTSIKTRIQSGNTISKAFAKVNKEICDRYSGFFVTAWVGCINLKTGVMNYVNAGHNPPLIKKEDNFEYMEFAANVVLGVMDFEVYEQYEYKFKKGDKLFLYTDGVTEAMNKEKKLYGNKRLKDTLNNNINSSVEQIIQNVKKDILIHSDGAEQSDDITMLAFEWKM